MTNILEKIKELRSKLMGYEMRLSILESDYTELSIELTRLYKMEKDLTYNIDFLKKERVVVVASQYYRSINQLKEVRDRISHCTALKNNVKKELNLTICNYEHYKDDFDKVFSELESESVILLFDERKKIKNGKKNKK